ncbi:MAG: hypothetical protein AABX23_01480 [Nanoarchaeota archaeon]
MKRNGVGSVVAYIILILIAVVGTSIFLRAYLGNVNKNTSGDSSLCFGIDLEVNNCLIFTREFLQSIGLPGTTGDGILINVERFPGGKDINDLRFSVTDDIGNLHVESPVELDILDINIDTNYSRLVEYNSVEAAVRNLDYTPLSVTVSAVVGKSDTICNPTRQQVICDTYVP